MYIEKVLDLWVQLMKNGGKNKSVAFIILVSIDLNRESVWTPNVIKKAIPEFGSQFLEFGMHLSIHPSVYLSVCLIRWGSADENNYFLNAGLNT